MFHKPGSKQSSSVDITFGCSKKRPNIHPYSSIWCVNVFSVLNLNIFSMACKPSIFWVPSVHSPSSELSAKFSQSQLLTSTCSHYNPLKPTKNRRSSMSFLGVPHDARSHHCIPGYLFKIPCHPMFRALKYMVFISFTCQSFRELLAILLGHIYFSDWWLNHHLFKYLYMGVS